jgi:hypothetical protein
MGFFNYLTKQVAESLGRSRRRTSGRKPAVRCQLLLEQLEDRLVPTVVFIPNFAHETIANNGPYTVLNSPKVDLIFWGTYWGTAPGVQDALNLSNEAQNILNSPYYSGLTEYGADGKVNIGNVFTDASSNPPSGYDPGALNVPANFTAAQAEVQFVLDNPQLSSLPIRGPGTSGDITQSPIYVVVSDAAHSKTTGGYNTAAAYQSNGASYPINLATFGVQSSNDQPGFGLDFSHELAERITDPTSNGVTVSYPPSPPFPSYLISGGQIGDGEQEPGGEDHYNYQLNGATVQSFLSASYGGDFIVPDGNSERIYLEPIWTTGVIPGSSPAVNGPVFTGNYDLFVTGYSNTIVTIDATDSLVTVNLNGQKFAVAPDAFGGGHIRNITVAPGIGENTINIQDLAADQTFTVLGNGADTVNVGNYYGSVQGIQGTVNISNAAHDTQLNVDDETDAGFRYAYLSNATPAADGDARGQITGLAPGAINYEYADTSQVNISTGKGGARVFVLATGTSTILQTLYYTTVEVGSSGSVQNIQGNLLIEGQAFALPMDLYVQDYSDAANRTVTLSTGVVGDDSHGYNENPTGQIIGLAPALISYEYGDTNSVTISTGTGGATVDVQATGVSTILQGNADNTTVYVGYAGSVQNIQGDLTIQNAPAQTAINVDDSADTTYQNVTLSTVTLANDFDGDNDVAGQISGLAPALITYEYIDTSGVTISTGIGGATVNVLATGVSTSLQGNGYDSIVGTTVNVGDAGSVQNITGDLTIENQPSLTAVNVDDSADATSRIVTLGAVTLADDGDGDSDAAGQISGLAPALINYEYIDTSGVTVRTGVGEVTVNVLATGVATSLVGNGGLFGENTTVNVGNAGSVQNILGDLTIENPNAFTAVNVDDSADATFRNATLSTVTLADDFNDVADQISGLAPALIRYEHDGASGVTISTGAGGATVSVLATSIRTTLQGNAANTTVNVGDAGSVQNILNDLTIQNVPAHTAVNVDDSTDAVGRTVTLSTVTLPYDGDRDTDAFGQISGLAPALIRYEYNDTSTVAISTGVGAAAVNVLATGDATSLLGHSANTIVNVGDAGSVQNILGALTIENPPSYTTLNVDDSADPVGRTVTLSAASIIASQISGLAPALITYRYRDTASPLTITGGSGGNTFVVSDVSGFFDGPAIVLNTGAGDDVVEANVSDVGGYSPLTVNGQAGNNRLVVTGADSPTITNIPKPNQPGAGVLDAIYSSPSLTRAIAYTNIGGFGATTTTQVSSDHAVSGSIYGQQVVLTAVVASGAGVPTGSVQFLVNGAAFGPAVALSGGTASLSTKALPAGSLLIGVKFTSAAPVFADSGATALAETVTPASLTITADNQQAPFGGPFPVLTVHYAGFVNGDTPASLTTPPTVATTATTASLAGGYAITASGAVDSNYAITYASGTLTVVAPPLQVTGIVVNDGNVQRSKVNSLTVTFNSVVTLGAGAIEVDRVGGTAEGVLLKASVVNGRTVVVVTFTGSDIVGGSLSDGDYQLVVHGGLVTGAAGQHLTGGDVTQKFFRLFGDFKGEGTVTLADLAQIRGALGSRTGGPKYLWFLDYDGNGVIDSFDYLQARNRLGKKE